ncbi:MAG: hypothetical protein JKY65_13335 [Planctomycetes bacterium]|nr:hypothetical protein [Planctomycetota bacterium]
MSRSAEDYRYEFPSTVKARQAAQVLGLAATLLDPAEGEAAIEEGLDELAPAEYERLTEVLQELMDLVTLESVRVEGATLSWTLVVHDDLQEYAPPEARELDYEGALLDLVREARWPKSGRPREARARERPASRPRWPRGHDGRGSPAAVDGPRVGPERAGQRLLG